jgi:hypothetical protein
MPSDYSPLWSFEKDPEEEDEDEDKEDDVDDDNDDFDDDFDSNDDDSDSDFDSSPPKRARRAWIMSWNRPNYKSTSLKTITEAIKFSNLSPYNSGSPRNHEGFQTKPRQTKIIVIQHNTPPVTTVHK